MINTEKPLMNAEFIQAVSHAIHSVWGDIAQDAWELGEMNNAGALELVLDADRLQTGGYKEAADLLEAAYKAWTYKTVARYLNRQIKLV
jgi:hypothetical protein